MRFTEFTVRFGFKGKFDFTEIAPRDMNIECFKNSN